MVEAYEVLLVDGSHRWHAGFLVDDETETDVLLGDAGTVLLFGSRPALEHHLQGLGLELNPDLPDEIDLDLGGWLPHGEPEPPAAEVLELWQLLLDDPAGQPLLDEQVEEAYDDLVEDVPGWFSTHGPAARRALAEAVGRLRRSCRPA